MNLTPTSLTAVVSSHMMPLSPRKHYFLQPGPPACRFTMSPLSSIRIEYSRRADERNYKTPRMTVKFMMPLLRSLQT